MFLKIAFLKSLTYLTWVHILKRYILKSINKLTLLDVLDLRKFSLLFWKTKHDNGEDMKFW